MPNVTNKQARLIILSLKGRGEIRLQPSTTTAVDDGQWAEAQKTQIRVGGKQVSLIETLEKEGAIEVAKAGAQPKAPQPKTEPKPGEHR